MEHLDYEVFISYNWGIKKQVDILHANLKSKCGYKVWRDETNMKNTTDLDSALADAIQKSKVFLFCLTEAYTKSINCLNELTYAIKVCKPAKPIVFLMIDKLELAKLKGLGVMLSRVIYTHCYKSKPIENWANFYHEEISNTIRDIMPVRVTFVFFFKTQRTLFINKLQGEFHKCAIDFESI